MNAASILRGLLYLAGVLASGAALKGYVDFNPATWVIDVHPFNLQSALTAAFTLFTNGMAALAVWRGWGKK